MPEKPHILFVCGLREMPVGLLPLFSFSRLWVRLTGIILISDVEEVLFVLRSKADRLTCQTFPVPVASIADQESVFPDSLN